MSLFNQVFDGKDYFECEKCESLAIIDENGKLMRMVFTNQGLPAIYEEKNKANFINENGSLKCDCNN